LLLKLAKLVFKFVICIIVPGISLYLFGKKIDWYVASFLAFTYVDFLILSKY
jgi:hypothetical protein